VLPEDGTLATETCWSYAFNIHAYLILCVLLVQYVNHIDIKMHRMDKFKIIGTLWLFYLLKPDCNRYLSDSKIVFYNGHCITQLFLNTVLWSIYSYKPDHMIL
jgi:hypothetical protein